jgi:hypothetical protein
MDICSPLMLTGFEVHHFELWRFNRLLALNDFHYLAGYQKLHSVHDHLSLLSRNHAGFIPRDLSRSFDLLDAYSSDDGSGLEDIPPSKEISQLDEELLNDK